MGRQKLMADTKKTMATNKIKTDMCEYSKRKDERPIQQGSLPARIKNSMLMLQVFKCSV